LPSFSPSPDDVGAAVPGGGNGALGSGGGLAVPVDGGVRS